MLEITNRRTDDHWDIWDMQHLNSGMWQIIGIKMSRYPNWYDQKKRLKENFLHDLQTNVLQQLERRWKSFDVL